MNVNMKKEIEEIFNNDYRMQITDIEKQTIIEYFETDNKKEFLKNREQFKLLKEINQKRVKFEKKLFDREYKNDYKNIDTLISFVSYAAIKKSEDIEETPIEKTINLFPSIKKLVLLYSIQTEKSFIEVKSSFKNKGIEVLGIEVDPDNVNSIYYNLKNLIKDKEINYKNSIIDITLGMRMVSIAFYKISTEEGIKTVSWQSLQLEDGLNRFYRIPGTTHFHFIENPKLANYKLYRAINEAIKTYDFKVVSSLYSVINNSDLENIYSELSNVFDLSTFDDYYNFSEEVSKLLRNFKNNHYKKEILTRFNKLIEFLEEFQEEENPHKIKKQKLLFYFLILEVLKNKDLSNDYIFDYINNKILKENNEFMQLSNEFNLKISTNEMQQKLIEDLNNIEIISDKISDFLDNTYILDSIVFDSLKDGDFNDIDFDNEKLIIEKNGIEISFEKYKEFGKQFLKNGKNNKFVRQVIKEKEVNSIWNLSKFEDEVEFEREWSRDIKTRKNSLTGEWNRATKYINKFNDDLKKILQEENVVQLEDKNLILIIDKKNTCYYKKKIKINEDFLK